MEINIEDIMKEIRSDIKAKGYTNDLLSFDEAIIDSSDMNANNFDPEKFKEYLDTANHEWQISSYRILMGNKIIVFFKKCLRKLMYFFVDPIVDSQNGFNATEVRLFNQLDCYIKEQQKEIESLKKRVAELESKTK